MTNAEYEEIRDSLRSRLIKRSYLTNRQEAHNEALKIALSKVREVYRRQFND